MHHRRLPPRTTDSIDTAAPVDGIHAPRSVRHRHDGIAAVRALVAAAFAVPGAALAGAARGRAPIAFARQIAMYLAHVSLGASFSEIGRSFGRDRTTAAHACRLVEERRDDPALDATVTGLEHALAALLASSAPRSGARR